MLVVEERTADARDAGGMRDRWVSPEEAKKSRKIHSPNPLQYARAGRRFVRPAARRLGSARPPTAAMHSPNAAWRIAPPLAPGPRPHPAQSTGRTSGEATRRRFTERQDRQGAGDLFDLDTSPLLRRQTEFGIKRRYTPDVAPVQTPT